MTTIGNYHVLRQIGEGGFGRTYEASHILRPKIKACLKQNLNITEEDAELLGNEADILATFSHQSLPGFRDFFHLSDGSYVLAMQFIDGKTLEHSVKKHKAIAPEDVAWVTQRTLQALYCLHSNGVIHGDVKPNNIIVQPEKHNAYLVDFGLYSLRPKATTKAVGYTEIFAAPEITQGKPPLPQSDLYSLGLTMIYALGGDPITKELPGYVPEPVRNYFLSLAEYDPLQRPSWDKEDLVKKLSDVRLAAFGKRHSGKV